jgi:hypothetical protein
MIITIIISKNDNFELPFLLIEMIKMIDDYSKTITISVDFR